MSSLQCEQTFHYVYQLNNSSGMGILITKENIIIYPLHTPKVSCLYGMVKVNAIETIVNGLKTLCRHPFVVVLFHQQIISFAWDIEFTISNCHTISFE